MIAGLMLAMQLGVTADRPNNDRWLGTDKFEHYGVSVAIEGTVYSALRTMHVGKKRSLVASTVATLALGIGKEALDRRRGFTFSLRDLTWDVAGISSAIGLLRRGTDQSRTSSRSQTPSRSDPRDETSTLTRP